MGLPTKLLGPSLAGISGLYAAGGKFIDRIIGNNTSGTSAYLMVFDSAVMPANGTTPIAEITTDFGISTAATENRETFSPDYLVTANGVYVAWSSTSGTLTAVLSGAGLLARIYGK